jgi:hypothetical protein
MVMQSYPVVSSAISALSYDDETEECEIVFKDGRSYILQGLPQIEFERMANAPSPGQYWNMFVKGNY